MEGRRARWSPLRLPACDDRLWGPGPHGRRSACLRATTACGAMFPDFAADAAPRADLRAGGRPNLPAAAIGSCIAGHDQCTRQPGDRPGGPGRPGADGV